jgi:hypothetical protein
VPTAAIGPGCTTVGATGPPGSCEHALAGQHDIAAATRAIRADLTRMTTLADAAATIDTTLAAADAHQRRRHRRDHPDDQLTRRRAALAAARAAHRPSPSDPEAATTIADYITQELAPGRHGRRSTRRIPSNTGRVDPAQLHRGQHLTGDGPADLGEQRRRVPRAMRTHLARVLEDECGPGGPHDSSTSTAVLRTTPVPGGPASTSTGTRIGDRSIKRSLLSHVPIPVRVTRPVLGKSRHPALGREGLNPRPDPDDAVLCTARTIGSSTTAATGTSSR